MTTERCWIFGFGSLIFAPELADQVVDRVPAEIPGLRRSFNKISRRRICPREHAFSVAVEPSAPIHHRDGFASLALGTVEDPEARVRGVLLGYPASAAAAVIEATDRREGWQGDRERDGYLREQLAAHPLDGGESIDAWVYVSNPASAYGVSPEVTVAERARWIIAATPRPGTPVPATENGVAYLEGVRSGLASLGIVDSDLERMAGAIRAASGPWRSLVAPPQGPTAA